MAGSIDITHDEIVELLGAYALDAVDPDERAVVERHLETCDGCRREVAEFHEVAAMLSSAAVDGLPAWTEISQMIATEPSSLLEEVPSLDDARRKRSARAPWQSIAAVAAAAALVVSGGALLSQQRRVADLQETLAQQEQRISELQQGESLEDAVAVALADPSSQLVSLTGEGGSVDFVLLPDGSAYLLTSDLPSLPSDQTYQLWAVIEDQVISAGILGPELTTTALRIEGDVHTLALTIESAGGVVVSDKAAAAAWVADA